MHNIYTNKLTSASAINYITLPYYEDRAGCIKTSQKFKK